MVGEIESILIVDDDERIRGLLVETLKKRGIPVLSARDGEEGLGIFDKEALSVLITDIMLPKMDGIQLVEKIRAREKGKALPIIMMSAVYRDLRMQGDLKSKFGAQFLVKPFSLKVLFQMLEEILVKKGNAKDTSSVEASEQGQIGHFSIPVVLVSFFSQGKTGVLTLKQGPKALRVYLDCGLPVYAEGRTPLKTREEVEEVLRSSMAWTEGDYSFQSMAALAREIPKFRYDLYNIVFEGAKRYYRLAFLINTLEKFQGHRVVRAEDFYKKIAHLILQEKEQQTIKRIDDQKTVADLVTHAPGEIESIFQMLWILQFMDAVSFQEK